MVMAERSHQHIKAGLSSKILHDFYDMACSENPISWSTGALASAIQLRAAKWAFYLTS